MIGGAIRAFSKFGLIVLKRDFEPVAGSLGYFPLLPESNGRLYVNQHFLGLLNYFRHCKDGCFVLGYTDTPLIGMRGGFGHCLPDVELSTGRILSPNSYGVVLPSVIGRWTDPYTEKAKAYLATLHELGGILRDDAAHCEDPSCIFSESAHDLKVLTTKAEEILLEPKKGRLVCTECTGLMRGFYRNWYGSEAQ